jgi:hypothetical protein
MARRIAQSNDAMEEIVFPVRGIDVAHEIGQQPPETTPVGQNVRAFEMLTQRGRGGQRGGLAKYVQAPIPFGPGQQVVTPQGEASAQAAASLARRPLFQPQVRGTLARQLLVRCGYGSRGAAGYSRGQMFQPPKSPLQLIQHIAIVVDPQGTALGGYDGSDALGGFYDGFSTAPGRNLSGSSGGGWQAILNPNNPNAPAKYMPYAVFVFMWPSNAAGPGGTTVYTLQINGNTLVSDSVTSSGATPSRANGRLYSAPFGIPLGLFQMPGTAYTDYQQGIPPDPAAGPPSIANVVLPGILIPGTNHFVLTGTSSDPNAAVYVAVWPVVLTKGIWTKSPTTNWFGVVVPPPSGQFQMDFTL